MAMSKEEKATRDALAQFEKDFAASQAAVARMNQPGVVSQATSAPTVVSNPRTALEAMSARYAAEARDFAAGTGRYGQPLNPIYGPSTTPTTTTTTTTQPTVTTGLTDAQILERQLAFQREQAAKLAAEQALQNRQSAFDLLKAQFAQYGLEALVDPLKGLIQENISPSEFAVRLRQTEPYKKRFAANASRIANGLRALSEGEYIALEDQYQNIMRNYGLPATYYTKGDMGRQEGFEKFIAGDVSPTELEDRVVTAQQRVLNAPPEVTTALKQFYPDITNGDILAYTLDPSKGLAEIKRKVTAAEIGGAALGQGLGTSATRAEELARFGITGEAARQGYQTVAEIAPRGSQLASIYKEEPYGQAEVETEVFGLTGSAEAAKRRKKLTGLEQAAFSGQAGTTGGALGRERAGSF